jgi:hypothetical protein
MYKYKIIFITLLIPLIALSIYSYNQYKELQEAKNDVNIAIDEYIYRVNEDDKVIQCLHDLISDKYDTEVSAEDCARAKMKHDKFINSLYSNK